MDTPVPGLTHGRLRRLGSAFLIACHTRSRVVGIRCGGCRVPAAHRRWRSSPTQARRRPGSSMVRVRRTPGLVTPEWTLTALDPPFFAHLHPSIRRRECDWRRLLGSGMRSLPLTQMLLRGHAPADPSLVSIEHVVHLLLAELDAALLGKTRNFRRRFMRWLSRRAVNRARHCSAPARNDIPAYSRLGSRRWSRRRWSRRRLLRTGRARLHRRRIPWERSF